MNNRKSPCKQQRTKNCNANRMRSNSSMGSTYTKNSNSHYGHYSHTTSPTANSSPAVPLFYSNTYADPPECSFLPKPPESWYLKSSDENLPVKIEEEKEIPKPKSYQKYNNKGFYSPFYSTKNYEKFPTPYISVKA
jgi:hypothetical protein